MDKNRNSKNKYQLNASSLVDLKAELARKQAQFTQQKLLAKDGVRKKGLVEKKPALWVKQNCGVADRAKKDMESVAEEDKSIEKSRKALEAKAKMYDQLSRGQIANGNDEEENGSVYLVDFQKKNVDNIIDNKQKRLEDMRRRQREEEDEERREMEEKLRREEEEEKERRRREEKRKEEEAEEKLLKEKIPEPDDSDEQWVDYVDSFGRTRRCMKKDLSQLVEMDEDLHGKKKPEASLPQNEYGRDLMSADMIREEQRKKWEQEERETMNGPVHYSNVRFDEIRSHGTGFFQFGRTEDERGEQMKNLHTLREQTLSLREKKEQLKAKRLATVQARLAKVKQRKMVQEGAPLPESLVEDLDPMNMKPKEEEPVELLVRDEALRQDAPTRDWDRGKKVIDLDTDYVCKRRQERENEFAPPSFYHDNQRNYRKEKEDEEEEEEEEEEKKKKEKEDITASISANLQNIRSRMSEQPATSSGFNPQSYLGSFNLPSEPKKFKQSDEPSESQAAPSAFTQTLLLPNGEEIVFDPTKPPPMLPQ